MASPDPKLDLVLEHLARLVAEDTRNPPRAIGTGGIFDHLRTALPGFTHTLTDYGAGAVTLLSVRGAPRRVFNFHLDTVPNAPGWTHEPLKLRVTDDRAVGLGACDIKGAVAAMIVAANATSGDLALLFSTDEEANDPRCIRGFLAMDHGYTEAIVAEPTGCRAVLAHRGIASGRVAFKGKGGHASEARVATDSAVHRAIRWGAKALDFAQGFKETSFGDLEGLPLNLGRIEGGIKSNVIAASCDVRYGFRPLPSQSIDALLAELEGLAPADELEAFEELFRGAPLPAGTGEAADAQMKAASALAQKLGLTQRPAVSFWTEAALFSQAGLTALVFGPGDISEAHTVDEWVLLSQLGEALEHYTRIIARENA